MIMVAVRGYDDLSADLDEKGTIQQSKGHNFPSVVDLLIQSSKPIICGRVIHFTLRLELWVFLLASV
jgi:hypothetical protein